MCLPLNNGREMEVDFVTSVGDGGEANSQASRLEKDPGTTVDIRRNT